MAIDWHAVRSHFPVCDRVTYLNAAGGSPMCAEASLEGKRYFDEMLLHGDACWDEWLERTAQVRERVARFIHSTSAEIAFTPNTSMAMGMIAQMLRDKGKVLTMKDEFPSSTLPWINLGFPVDFVSPVQGTYPLTSIEKAIRPEHRILVTSYIQYKTGFRQDLVQLGQLCRMAKLTLVVNATQGMGIFPIDVQKSQIDFLAFSGLKWACAGYGASGLFIRKDLLPGQQWPMTGWRSVRSPEIMDNQRHDWKDEASVVEAGSPSFPAVFALGGALELLQRIGIEACMTRVIGLSRLLENNLQKHGFQVMFSFPDDHRSGILMIRTPHAKKLVFELAQKKVLVSARGEGLRISVNIFNNEDDIDKLVTVLKDYRSMF